MFLFLAAASRQVTGAAITAAASRCFWCPAQQCQAQRATRARAQMSAQRQTHARVLSCGAGASAHRGRG